jgi:16S rRNA (adenine1518-N6/adenine1519-N6)-dimethyltransferase
MPEEFFDVVDEQDRVLGRAPRSVVHAHRILHRAAHIFLFNLRGQLLLQLRSAHKDEYPLCYTSSASGHLDSGETYDEAAPREMREELGVEVPLERLAKFSASPQTAHEHTVLYRAISDVPPKPDPQEIAGLSFHSLAEITHMLQTTPEKFSPPFVVLFEWYVANQPSTSNS